MNNQAFCDLCWRESGIDEDDICLCRVCTNVIDNDLEVQKVTKYFLNRIK
jgi:hypothetical protein